MNPTSGVGDLAFFAIFSIPFLVTLVPLLVKRYKNGHRISYWPENGLPVYYPFTKGTLAEIYIAFGVLTAYREEGESLKNKLVWINQYLKTHFPNLKHQVFESYEGARISGLNLNELICWVKMKVPEKDRCKLMEFIILLAASNGGLNPKEMQFIYVLMTNWKVSLHQLDEDVQSLFLGDSTKDEEVIKESSVSRYYAVLGLTEGVTLVDLKKAYRILAKKYHPDTSHFLSDSEKRAKQAKFIEIQKAYEIVLERLSN